LKLKHFSILTYTPNKPVQKNVQHAPILRRVSQSPGVLLEEARHHAADLRRSVREMRGQGAGEILSGDIRIIIIML